MSDDLADFVAAVRATTAALRKFSEQLRQFEAETVFTHPDIQELDLMDAAWYSQD